MEDVIKRLANKVYINNEYVPSVGGKNITVVNPATEQIVSSDVAAAGSDDLDKAVAVAEAVFEPGSPWRNMTATQRCHCLWKLAELLNEPENAETIARLESVSFGKPYSTLVKNDIGNAANQFRYFAGWCDKINGDFQNSDQGFTRIVKREPVGVSAAIIAWNGPTVSIAMKAGPCLASGSVMILKPSEKTPLGALFIADLFRQAGFPPGVFQVLPGDGSLGALISSHMRIRKVSFTGSVPVGKKIQEAAAKSNLKRVTLELGGKSPVVICDDANLDNAALWSAMAITLNSGQYCIAGSRVYVQDGIYDAFVEKYLQNIKQMSSRMGDPSDPQTTYGTVADKLQYDRVNGYIAAGKEEADILTGGSLSDKGYFVEPTVFANPKKDAKVYKEEIFGPVAVVKRFHSDDEVIRLANDTEYGLMASVFTTNLGRGARLCNAIEAGTVCLNTSLMISVKAPFGGVKQSGYGSEGGLESVLAYTVVKTIVVKD
ncbi:aldehyde dehydrogenase domain-containing protein [Ilyonectria sp. MPI-CAGE-AT-0026]|nr:aldehyde dehydrogenase domain-containing protein [Ilyonectria sp. MPI-CAGE-AT-0026]